MSKRLMLVLAVVLAVGAVAGAVIVAVVLRAGDRLADTGRITEAFGSPGSIGELFLSDHLLAFEVTSIVLLIAAVGGVILGSSVPPGERAESARRQPAR